jgi:outer membrane protein
MAAGSPLRMRSSTSAYASASGGPARSSVGGGAGTAPSVTKPPAAASSSRYHVMTRTALLLLFLAAPALAAAQPLTLDEAIALALARNPEIRAASAGEAAAAARVGQARAGWLPRVDLTEAWQRGDHPVFVFSSLLAQRRFTAGDFALDALNHPEAVSNHRVGLALEQSIFDGFRTRGAVRAARLGAEIAALDSTRARADLRLEVVRAFGGALAAAAHAEAAATAVATVDEDLRRASDRRDAGVETDATVLAFQVQRSEAEFRLVTARADASVARAELNALLALPLDDDRPLTPLPPRPGAPTEAPLLEPAKAASLEPAKAASLEPAEAASLEPAEAASLEDEAVRRRPEIAQAAARHQQAQAMLASARAGYWPQVVAHAGTEANGATVGDRGTAWSAGVQVRWNLFAGGADAARVAEATAEIARAEAAREGIERGIRLAVRTAAAGHEAALARERTGRRMVEQARESQRIIRDRYEAGLAPASELLRAAELVAQAEAARIAAAINVHVAAAALERAAGRFE